MKEGYWLNLYTGKYFTIDEHEQWLRSPGNAKKLGIPQKVIDLFSEFTPARDRNRFLILVMQHAPVMRIRGHGGYVTFEYSSRSRNDPLDAIGLWGRTILGPLSEMNIVNFATGEMTNIRWSEFKKAVDGGGYESVVLSAANTQKFDWSN